MELGLTEKAVSKFKKYLEISPKMIDLFKDLVERGELPREILE